VQRGKARLCPKVRQTQSSMSVAEVEQIEEIAEGRRIAQHKRAFDY
jgi:hypothetical protein